MSIESYKFKDSGIEGATIETIETDECIMLIDDDYDISTIFIYKDDVIAMAKHFKLINQ
jgi:hypothetical protein